MPKSQSAWGIEIGAFAIKALRLERDGSEVLVKDFAYIPHAKPLSTPETDENEIIRNTLQQFLAAKNIEDAPVVVSVPGNVGLARFAKLPPVEPKKIPDIVKFEAVQQIPFPIEEVEWDYQTFSSPDNPEVEVGIFAITKERIGAMLALYAEFGIRPEIVTQGPLAVFNALSFDLQLGDQHKPIVALDIGTRSSDVVVAESGRCWVRTFPKGGTHFTEALAEAFNVKYAKADKLKAESASSKYARQMMQAMRPVFGELVSEVQKSVGHYQMSHRENRIEHVYGLGSTFRIPGLRKFLGQQLNIEVERLDEFKRIRVEGREAADFAANSVNFVTAYGLALQGVGLSRISVNLAPVQGLREKVWAAKNKWFVAAACLAVAVSAGLFVRPGLERQALESGAGSISVAKSAISQGEGLKSRLAEANGKGQAGSRAPNVLGLLRAREVWPQIVRDAFAVTLSSKPTEALALSSPEAAAAMPPAKMNLIVLTNLAGTYHYGEEDKSRTIDVTMKVEFVNMNKTGPTFLNDTAAKWLRDNADRKDVPYVIDTASIKATPEAEPFIKPAAPPAASGATPPAGADAPAPDQGAEAAPPPPPPDAGQEAGQSRGRGRGTQFGGGAGGAGSKSGATIDPTAQSTPQEPTEPNAPAAADPVEEKAPASLEEAAPLPKGGFPYGPEAVVYKGTITFRVKLRDGAAKPAEEGAKP